ncbi:DUF1501 domain-containing protein [Anatilimnocola sp. NA78]|uniref:DUF1501 domain-containing protein n=1 Tax=Anatilimnocola sp. NA78 TaxID=3415683 RepID=UPI003CE51750
MNPFPANCPHELNRIGRRSFLSQTGLGLGAAALATYLPRPSTAAEQAASRGLINPLHHPPKIKRVIFLYMSGGPSHLETFDHKPELTRRSGEAMPESITSGQPIAQLQGRSALKVLGPVFEFHKHGQSGQQISSVLPHIGKIADDICIVRSMVTEAINHDPAHTFMNTGTTISGRPSLGSWLLYGLGSESENLPGFVVLTSEGGRNPQPISSRMWHSGFLPSKHQGVMFNSKGAPVHYLNRPAGVSAAQQQDVIDAVRELQRQQQATSDDAEIATRVSQYEMAARMQLSVPQLMDIRDEPASTLEMYGCQPGDGSFASNCLLARRMAERGVRFIQLYHRDWDHHNDLHKFMNICAGHCDQASAALVQDLKQRGLLKDTLVIWGGEFGRTPMAQDGKGAQLGRDHHMKAFSLWLAGGGIKPGITYGNTDDFGYHAVENVVNVHDLHATLLHLLGIDHERLTYFTQGRDFRLTDVAGKVVNAILA